MTIIWATTGQKRVMVVANEETLDKVEQKRLETHKEKGCAYWLAEINKPNCSFPRCFCYPYWQLKYGIINEERS